ncbi:MAG: hypothetical protein KKG21_03160 [Candidatus Omnitrophica bacterium]|nr:hypothetical protein [Candidatus Omnitrophota bacterium]
MTYLDIVIDAAKKAGHVHRKLYCPPLFCFASLTKQSRGDGENRLKVIAEGDFLDRRKNSYSGTREDEKSAEEKKEKILK